MPKIEDCIEYVDGDFIYAKDQLLKWNKKDGYFFTSMGHSDGHSKTVAVYPVHAVRNKVTLK